MSSDRLWRNIIATSKFTDNQTNRTEVQSVTKSTIQSCSCMSFAVFSLARAVNSYSYDYRLIDTHSQTPSRTFTIFSVENIFSLFRCKIQTNMRCVFSSSHFALAIHGCMGYNLFVSEFVGSSPHVPQSMCHFWLTADPQKKEHGYYNHKLFFRQKC